MQNSYTIQGGIAAIVLTQGKTALMDAVELNIIALHTWYCNNGYAIASIRNADGRRGKIYLHRLILV